MTLRALRQRRSIRVLAILSLGVLIPAVPAAMARSPQAATPQPGGAIAIRLTNAPDCMDDYKSALAQVSSIDGNIHLGLTSFNAKQRPIPGIAKSWKVSNGGKTITFNLRTNVKFADGHLLTSADVKASFAHANDPATKSPVSKSFLAQVTKVTAPNKFTVKLTLSTPSRVILNNLATNYLGILEKSQLDKVGQNTCNGLIGEGPYRITSVGTGYSSVQLKQNPHYYNFNLPWAHNKGKPYLSTLNFINIPNDATAISELLAGQIDLTGVPGPELSRVQGNKNIALHKVLAQSEFLILFNTTHPPFNDVKVRRAVAQAIDRSEIIKGSFNGLAKPAYGPLPSTIAYSDPKAQSYAPKLNPSAATAAISAAGAKGPYTLLTFAVPTTQSMAEIAQAELGNVGMQTNIVAKTVGDWVVAASKGQFDIAILNWEYNDPDILYLLYNSSQGGGKGLDFTNYTNAQLDKLTAEGRAELNPKKAKADYIQAQKILMNNVVIDPLTVPVGITALRKRVQGWHTDNAGNVVLQDLYINKK